MTQSASIDIAVTYAEADGNTVLQISTGWSKVREVVHMKDPMTDLLRSKLSAVSGLRGWSSQRTPHNAAEEGFTDDTTKVSIAFPAVQESS